MKLTSLATLDLFAHFVVRWPRKVRAVYSDYLVVRECKHFLADLVVRGGVMSVPPAGLSDHDAGVWEGRRQLAVELLRALEEDPRRLFAIVEKTEMTSQPQQQPRRTP